MEDPAQDGAEGTPRSEGQPSASAAAGQDRGRAWFSSSALMNDHQHRLVRLHPTLDPESAEQAATQLQQQQQKHEGRGAADDADENPASFRTPEWPDEGPMRIRQSATHLLQSWETSARVLRRCLSSLQDPKTELGFGVMVCSVMGLGMYEGFLLTKKRSLDMETFRFITRYGWENILPSFIWKTKQAATIVRAQGREFPSKMLWTPSHPITPDEASRQSLIQSIQTMRALVAGFIGIAQAFNVAAQGIEASHQYRQKVLRGREPLLTYSGPRERIVRLGGKSSNCTELSVELDGLHIVPIVEDPGVVRDYTRKGVYPIFWSVHARSYGNKQSWHGFNIDHRWMIKTKQGKRILIIEADSSVGEQSLSLRHDIDADLTLQDASQAFVMIEGLLRQDSHVKPDDRVVRVLLADPMMGMETGGGNRYTILDRVRELREVDVLIDSKAPLLRAILDWANQHYSAPEDPQQPPRESQPHATLPVKSIVFDTTNKEYFGTLRDLLQKFGFEVLDSRDADQERVRNLPRLVYMETTYDTLNTIRSLVNVGLVSPSRCCALVDQKEGLSVAADINRSLIHAQEAVQKSDAVMQEKDSGTSHRSTPSSPPPIQQVGVICSSVIYDNLFRQVRLLLREGRTPAEVQDELDRAFSSYSLAMRSEIKEKKEAPDVL